MLFLLLVIELLISSVLSEHGAREYYAAYGCDLTYGNVTEVQTNTRSVIECIERCSKNDLCLSVKYNPPSMMCHLNSERYLTTTNIDCPATFRYAQLKKTSCGQLMHDDCTVSNECSVTHSLCVDGKCQCDHGYSYNHRTETCVTECDVYGPTFTLHNGHRIEGLTTKAIHGADSINVCKQACAEETTFICRTVDYRHSIQMCLLSIDTALTAPQNYVPDNRYNHLQRDCQ